MQLNWTSALETGVKQVDEEHRVLIDELNKLGVMLNAERIDMAAGQSFMAFLGTYTARHFAHEEKCMHELNCPLGTANKAAHAQFIKMFVAAKLRMATGATMAELRSLHASLCEWVKAHIIKIDTGLRSCKAHHAG
jgi:hemerythrin